MGLRPTNGDEKHAGGECRANMAGLRGVFFRECRMGYGPPMVMKNTPAPNAGRASGACFSGECPMGLRPTNNDEKHAGGECRANMAGLRACFSRGAVRTFNFAPESS